MDTLAYYQCRANNPKADHPIQGYHAFSEEQRDHLREKQREGAEEIVRMFAATRVPVQGEPNDDREALVRVDRMLEDLAIGFPLEDIPAHYPSLDWVSGSILAIREELSALSRATLEAAAGVAPMQPSSTFQDLGDGLYRVPAMVSPTTGRYITGEAIGGESRG